MRNAHVLWQNDVTVITALSERIGGNDVTDTVHDVAVQGVVSG